MALVDRSTDRPAAANLPLAVRADRFRRKSSAWSSDPRRLVGLSLMVFFAIACQCMSTLAVVKRETRSWTWPTFLFIYTGALAWLLSFAVFQGGVLLGFG